MYDVHNIGHLEDTYVHVGYAVYVRKKVFYRNF
jgi:hypothetical protein